MRQVKLMILLLGLLAVNSFARDVSSDFAQVKHSFNAFQYRQVIKQAQALLKSKDLNTQQKIEVLRMKAIAHYVLNQRDMAALCFADILKIKPDYRLDPMQNSPKLIRFFEKIKANYTPKLRSVSKGQKEEAIIEPPSSGRMPWKGAVLRSLFIPGWGHVHAGEVHKGWLLSGISLMNLSAAVFMAVRTNNLERQYMNATEQKQIDSRYRDYNNAYRWRNGLFIAYAFLWTYTQVDLSFRLSDHTVSRIRASATPPKAMVSLTLQF